MSKEEILRTANEKMEKAIASTGNELGGVRTGRASAGLLDRVQVDYYGTKTPLKQLASFTVPEPQTLVVQPWDKSSIPAVEKGILQADLGLTPSNDGNIIRVPFPPLSEERRKDLVRVVRKMAEDGRVAVRNIRRDANEHLKALEKAHEISEDESERAQHEVQRLTDDHIKKIDEILKHKEAEIMEV